MGEAQHIGMPTLMLVEKAYCFLATSAIYSIYFNYRGEAQHIGINLKHPLCHSISTTGSMFSPLLLQGPGIEPWKSALKLDTLTTDLLGTVYNKLKFPDLIKHAVACI